ncbi:hypothetical protein TWF730_009402 [Orbilia blumenaviensis]|uniref:Uncharacterized protein n=1 Tax=Orbilia blumenaviensis TaxID=1796055 RepID=A0AAV9UYG5_9PEZI
MVGKQKKTYLVYSRGLLPEDLKLGSLYIDPANPLDGERKRFESSLSESELANWVGKPDVNAPLTLSFSASRQWTVASGIFSLLDGEIGRGRSKDIIISGKSGTRFEIRKPETFLNNVVLKSEGARAWLANYLSVSRHLEHLHRTFGKGTRIWLVTGIQTVVDAKISIVDRQDKQLGFSATAPAPDPIIAAVTVLTGQGGMVSVGMTNTISRSTSTMYGHTDSRVWAAQFTELSVKFKPKGSGLCYGDSPGTWIRLHDLPNHKNRGIRAGGRPINISGEIAEIVASGKTNDDDEQLEGEDLLELMQDVDWEELDRYL